jgi:hypothetical protein
VYSSLQFIAACHPNSSWQAAAHAALQQLSSTTIYIESAAAAAAAAKQQHACAPVGGTAAGQEGSNSMCSGQRQTGPDRTASALQQLIQHAEQLEDWVDQLQDLQAATAAAATGIVLDPECAPVLLLNAAAALQHPIWAQDYAAFSNTATATTAITEPVAAAVAATTAAAAAAAAAATAATAAAYDLPFKLPAESELIVGGGARLDIRHHYTTAGTAAGRSGTARSQPDQQRTSSSSSAECIKSAAMPWPLTAAASKVVLSSLLGVVPDHQLRQVHGLGVVGRCGALADAVDLARLVGAELAAAQVINGWKGGVGCVCLEWDRHRACEMYRQELASSTAGLHCCVCFCLFERSHQGPVLAYLQHPPANPQKAPAPHRHPCGALCAAVG